MNPVPTRGYACDRISPNRCCAQSTRRPRLRRRRIIITHAAGSLAACGRARCGPPTPRRAPKRQGPRSSTVAILHIPLNFLNKAQLRRVQVVVHPRVSSTCLIHVVSHRWRDIHVKTLRGGAGWKRRLALGPRPRRVSAAELRPRARSAAAAAARRRRRHHVESQTRRREPRPRPAHTHARLLGGGAAARSPRFKPITRGVSNP